MRQFRYAVAAGSRLINGQWVELGTDENGDPNPLRSGRENDAFWVTEKRHRIGFWKLDENNNPVEADAPAPPPEALAEIRIARAPNIIARISVHMDENVSDELQLAYAQLITAVGQFISFGSYQRAKTLVDAEIAGGLAPPSVSAALSFVSDLLAAEIEAYYG